MKDTKPRRSSSFKREDKPQLSLQDKLKKDYNKAYGRKDDKRKSFDKKEDFPSRDEKRREFKERSFDKPRSERSFGDRPKFGDKPRFGDRSRGERSFDRPRDDRKFGDRPRFDRPREDRKFGDKPRSDRPRREGGFDKPMLPSYSVITTTLDTLETAKELANKLIAEKLVACVQINAIESIYTWEDKIEDKKEFILSMKTKANLFEKVAEFIKANHSYEIPEIIQTPIRNGNPEYLKWIENNTI